MNNQSEIKNLTLADLVDSNIISHRFLYYKRDYYFHTDTIVKGDFSGQFLLLFKH
jgi:hypothetical protein